MRISEKTRTQLMENLGLFHSGVVCASDKIEKAIMDTVIEALDREVYADELDAVNAVADALESLDNRAADLYERTVEFADMLRGTDGQD